MRLKKIRVARSMFTAALWHPPVHTNQLNQASNVTTLDWVVLAPGFYDACLPFHFRSFEVLFTIYTFCSFLIKHKMINIKRVVALGDCYEAISANGLWPSDLADKFYGPCAMPCLGSLFYSRCFILSCILISKFQKTDWNINLNKVTSHLCLWMLVETILVLILLL